MLWNNNRLNIDKYNTLLTKHEHIKEMEQRKDALNNELTSMQRERDKLLEANRNTLRELENEYNSTSEGLVCNAIPDDVLRLLNYTGRSRGEANTRDGEAP